MRSFCMCVTPYAPYAPVPGHKVSPTPLFSLCVSLPALGGYKQSKAEQFTANRLIPGWVVAPLG